MSNAEPIRQSAFYERGRFLHYCHCGQWGSRGIGVRLLNNKLGQWYCAAHIAEAREEKPVEQAVRTPPPIPSRFRATCEFCGSELNTQADGIHQWTAGWVMQRAGGGGHGISLPERSNRWAHRQCVENAVRGGVQQQSMF
jgi:hypothetical protein